MLDKRIAKRYAKAFFNDDVAKNKLDILVDEVKELGSALETEKRYREFMSSRLPGILKVKRQDRKPLVLLYDEDAGTLKTDIGADPDVWDQVLKLERSQAYDDVILVDIGDHLKSIFKKLDELTKIETDGV